MSLRNPLSNGDRTETPQVLEFDLPEFSWLADRERLLWLALVAIMLGDVLLTIQGRNVGLVEVNPVARGMLDSLGHLGLLGLKGIAVAMGLVCRFAIPARHRALVPLGLAVPTAAAVLINATLIAMVVF